MPKKIDNRIVYLPNEEIQKINRAIANFYNGQKISLVYLAEKTGISRSTIYKILKDKRGRADTIELLYKALNLPLSESVDKNYFSSINTQIKASQEVQSSEIEASISPWHPSKILQNELTGLSTPINWYEVCRKMLCEQTKGLTTNPITASGGIKFDLEDIYIKLRLETYKQLDTYPQSLSAFERLNPNQLPKPGDTKLFENEEQFGSMSGLHGGSRREMKAGSRLLYNVQ